MRIIGKTDSGYLLESSKDELYHLIGYYWSGSEGAPKQLNIGDDIRVSAMFHQLNNLAQRKKEPRQVAERLRALAALLEAEAPVVEAILTEQSSG